MPSGNYTGPSNGTAHFSPVVEGKAFDRFIQIWLENTDYQTAASAAQFQKLASQGLLLTSFHGVTHPSEPNYIASVGGDFFGLGDDNYYNIPSNISTVVDLLEAKNISWAEYQENMPTEASPVYSYASTNYLNASAPNYSYYQRKHNPLVIYDSVGKNASRMPFIRNFNDFANDLSNATLPQWMFVTPNMVRGPDLAWSSRTL
jgi:phospholipase C